MQADAAELALCVREQDITPHPSGASGWMSGYGYGKRSNLDGAAARPLRAQCLVLWENGRPNVMLRVDVIGIPRRVHMTIRRRVLAAVPGLDSASFLLAASHTHSGPFVGDERLNPRTMIHLNDADIAALNAYTDHLINQLVHTVRMAAYTPPVPVILGYVEGRAEISRNRTGLKTHPQDVSVLAAYSVVDGSVLAVLFGHACHPVCRGYDEIYDSDYCGFAAQLVEDELGAPALFFQGCCGDLNPDVDDDVRGEEVIANFGTILGRKVVHLVRDAAFVPVTAPLETKLEEIALPLAVDTGDADVVAALHAKYQQRVADLPDDDSAEGGAHRHAEIILGQISDGTLPRSVPMPIQRWRFDGLSILALGHEVVSGYRVDIREQFTNGPLWVMAYANEVSLYVPSDELLWRGGYEAGWNDDPTIAGIDTSLIFYPWPVPLRSTPRGQRPPGAPADPHSAEGILMRASLNILNS
jgi:hypothetical protein